MKDISAAELKEWYETKTIEEVMAHFEIKSATTVYQLLKKAGIPLKAPHNAIRLVD